MKFVANALGFSIAVLLATSIASAQCTDADIDGYYYQAGCGSAQDCNDANSTVHPGAVELCNGIDDNCNGLTDEDAQGADSDGDGIRNACDNCPQVYNASQSDSDHDGVGNVCDNCIAANNPTQADNDHDLIGDACDACTDTDADGYGNPGFPASTCALDNCPLIANSNQNDSDGDGIGTACDSCPSDAQNDIDVDGTCGNEDNCPTVANANQLDTDVDGRGDLCDNCPRDSNASQGDNEGDGAGDACDNCLFDYNSSQSDFDHDVEGDVCDLNDGLIYLLSTDTNHREWQAETGYTTWNSYRGALSVLRAFGDYTQDPGSNPLAAHNCGLSDVYVLDLEVPAPGEVAFNLITGVAGGVESGLGTNSAGVERVNTSPPCDLGVTLEVIGLTIPPVTVSANGPSSSCVYTVTAATATFRNLPTNQFAGTSPFNDIILQSVSISYLWDDGLVQAPASAGIGGSVPAGGSGTAQFSVISNAALRVDGPNDIPGNGRSGHTASLAMTFIGTTVSGEAVSAASGGTLPVNSCIAIFGACCVQLGCVDANTQAQCTQAGGVYQGDNTTCATLPNSCP